MKLFTAQTFIGIAIGVALVACVASHADNLKPNEDKVLHFAGSAAIAGGVTLATGDKWTGFLVASAVGVGKELYDKQHRDRHNPSYHDLAADLIGAACGAWLGDYLHKTYIRPSFNDGRLNGLTIAYTTEF